MVKDFAAQFVELEAENARLHQELAAAKSSAEQIETANKLATDAWQEAEDLKKELGQVKAKLEEEERLKEEAQSQAEKREDKLRKSIETLLGKSLRHLHPSFLLDCYDLLLVFSSCSGAADTPVDRTNKLRVDSMTAAISFVVDSSE